MRFGVVVFPASNCDADCYYVIKDVINQEVEYIWHKNAPADLDRFDCIILPGGFSYGDYLRPGAIAKFAAVMEGVVDYAHRGGLVLGICNGFQVLLETGLLPGAMQRNANLKFRCHYTYLRVENNNTPFTRECARGQVLKIPIAHGDGNYYADADTLARLEAGGQVVFRYSTPAGEVTPDANPNGSINNIAGICNPEGNVLGMMPHPERCAEEILGSADGRLIFESILKHWESRVSHVR